MSMAYRRIPVLWVRRWRLNIPSSTDIYEVRPMSSGRRNFIADFIENMRQDLSKNKEMKESLKKFRDEAAKLEQSESLQKAREKYQSIEAETARGSEAFKQKFEEFQGKFKETLEEMEKSEYAKRGKEWADEMSRTMEKTAQTMSKQGEQLAQSSIFRSVSQGVKVVKEEIDESAFSRGRLYKPPVKLFKRDEVTLKGDTEKFVEPNEEASGMVLHKDSVWYQSWQNFKDNNQFVHKLFDIKMRYDESDNLLVRATRTFTDKVTEVFGGVFSKTEMSEVLTEIIKMDPTFDKEEFIKLCQYELIPNILEAMVRGELDILKDWCYEAAFNVLSHPIKQAQTANYVMASKVLDINNIDIAAAKLMEQGPVLVMSFNAQQIMCVKDKAGKVIEGDPEKIMRIFYVWAFCRDQTVLDPRAAWRLIDLSASPMEQWL